MLLNKNLFSFLGLTLLIIAQVYGATDPKIKKAIPPGADVCEGAQDYKLLRGGSNFLIGALPTSGGSGGCFGDQWVTGFNPNGSVGGQYVLEFVGSQPVDGNVTFLASNAPAGNYFLQNGYRFIQYDNCTTLSEFWVNCTSSTTRIDVYDPVLLSGSTISVCETSSAIPFRNLISSLPLDIPVTGETQSGTSLGQSFNVSSFGVGSHPIKIITQFANGNRVLNLTINVQARPRPDLSFIPDNFCTGGSTGTVILTGTPVISPSTPTPTLQTINVSGTGNVSFNFPWTPSAGNYTVAYTVSNAVCGSVVTSKNVQVGTNFTLTANANPSLCEGSTVNLGTTTPPTVPGGVTGTGAWSLVSSCPGCLSGSVFTPPNVSGGTATDFTVRYTFTGTGVNAGCVKSVDKTVTVRPKPELSFSNTTVQQCAQGIVSLNNAFRPRNLGIDIDPASWNVGSLSSQYNASTKSVNAGNVVISGAQQTFPLTFSFTNSLGCSETSSTVNLILDKIPNAPTNTNTTASLRACGSGTFNLTASGAITGETYVWRNEAGQTV
ncbi:MAG: hypothetical protein O9338_24105, partial [Microcystis sp. LE19-251.1A]|nr:hypothetical protein [Microcystis sp. LE19-251.1A]